MRHKTILAALAALDKAMGTTIRTKGLKFKGYEF
jgi:hypothetical protein